MFEPQVRRLKSVMVYGIMFEFKAMLTTTVGFLLFPLNKTNTKEEDYKEMRHVGDLHISSNYDFNNKLVSVKNQNKQYAYK